MRIQSIDYLRGLMSLSIVIYHFSVSFTKWGMSDSSTLLGRLGIYAVSAFYVISGMALYLAHKNEKWNFSQYLIFIARRFLRLAPVYWVALIAYTIFIVYYHDNFVIDWVRYAQNIFLTFGVSDPKSYLIMGGWSIGCEVVFYLFFPALIIVVKNNIGVCVLIFAGLILLLENSFYALDVSHSLASQWVAYINPINHFFYFLMGVVLAKLLFPYVAQHKIATLISLAILIIMFILYPAVGDQIHIVSGYSKIFFSLVVLGVCVCFYLIKDFKGNKLLHGGLNFLGCVSYPLYLLHGVTFNYFSKVVETAGASNEKLILCIVSLLVILLPLSWLCHVSIEKPIIKLSKKYLATGFFLKAKNPA